MKLTLGFSPCPNDCFIFDALVHGRVDTEGLEFDVALEDVETLNTLALKGVLDVSKLSFHTFGYVTGTYILLRAGSALGFNCGPLLISKEKIADPSAIRSVAIPGKLTTANFLLSIALPALKDKHEYLFSEIEEAVLRGETDAGLIIHENRFTYQEKGLQKVMDLGEYWESLIHAPIPLGGIVARRSFDAALQQKISRVIKRSLQFAFGSPETAMPYVRRHAQAMSEDVMKKHIALYVNDFSLELGETGEKAIRLMFEKAAQEKLFSLPADDLMIAPSGT